MLRGPQGWEWLIILAIVLLLFGAKRLPDAARGLGRSLRILKAETKGLHDEPEAVAATEPAALPKAASTPPAIPSSVDVSDVQPEPLPPAPDASRRPTA
jgi:sec-independent protein translocase protein TatA